MHVIITGGSSGIGLEIARCYLKAGQHVSIISRDLTRLMAAKQDLSSISENVLAVEGDVCDAAGIRDAIQICERGLGPCDLLVTAAGIVDPAFFHALEPASFKLQIDTNFMGTVNSVAAVYGGMKTRGWGGLMLVSSAAGHLGIPGYAAYCASKAAVASFAESLRCEADRKIYVGVCFPPDTDTPQFHQELKKRPRLATLLIGKKKPWPAEKVARHIVGGIARRKARIHFGCGLRALALGGGVLKPILYRLFFLRRG